MKTPVPDDDLRRGELSDATRRMIFEGKLSELDWEIAQILRRINERYNISNASFFKALDLGRAVLVLTRGEAGLLIGKDGKIVSELSSALGRKVRIVEVSGDVKKSVADVIMPTRLLGINQIFHEGREITKVRIARSEVASLPIDIPTLERALRSLIGHEVQLVFE